MSDGSKPPQERVNIVYKTDDGGAQAEKELPLRIMIIGDFTGRTSEVPVEERSLVEVDQDSFRYEEDGSQKIMAQQNISLQLAVDNEIDPALGEQLGVRLNLRSITDFEPDNLVTAVPEIKELLDLREALSQLKEPLSNNREFVKRLQTLLSDDNERQGLLDELEMGTTKE